MGVLFLNIDPYNDIGVDALQAVSVKVRDDRQVSAPHNGFLREWVSGGHDSTRLLFLSTLNRGMFPYKGKNHDIVFDLEIPNSTQSDRPRDAASELVLALTLTLLKLELSAHEAPSHVRGIMHVQAAECEEAGEAIPCPRLDLPRVGHLLHLTVRSATRVYPGISIINVLEARRRVGRICFR